MDAEQICVSVFVVDILSFCTTLGAYVTILMFC